MTRMLLYFWVGCIPLDSNVNPSSSETPLAIDSGDLDTELRDTAEIDDTDDTEDTIDTDGPSIGNFEDGRQFMSASHLVLKNNIYLTNSSFEISHSEHFNQVLGLGTESFPLLNPNMDWGFGFKWAPDSEETAKYMFGEPSNQGIGTEMLLFQVANVGEGGDIFYLSIQFYPVDVDNEPDTVPEYSIHARYYSERFNPQQNTRVLCREVEFEHSNPSEKRTYTRDSLERGFRLFAMFEAQGEHVEAEHFTLALETIRPSDDDWDSFVNQADPDNSLLSPYWMAPVSSTLSDSNGTPTPLVSRLVDEEQSCRNDRPTPETVHADFGRKVTLSNQHILDHIQGRVDDLVIYQTASPTFQSEVTSRNSEAVNRYFLVEEVGDLISFYDIDDPLWENDNLFWWNFDQDSDTPEEIRDASAISVFEYENIEPDNEIPLYFTMIRQGQGQGGGPNSSSPVDSQEAGQYYDD